MSLSRCLSTYFCRCADSHACPVQFRLDIPWSGGSCNLYFANHHSHDSPSSHGLSAPVKRKIAEGVQLRLQPHQILRSLTFENLPAPDPKQLSNEIYRCKVARYGPGSLTTGALEKWCKEREFTDQLGLDDPFVSMYNSDHEKPFFFVTTRRLTLESTHSFMLQSDATYKLNWETYPVIVTGTSDRNGSFRLSGIALIWSDEDTEAYRSILEAITKARTLCGVQKPIKYIMADGVSSLSGAIANSPYAGAKRLMCWAHMKRNVRDKRPLLGADSEEKWAKVDRELTVLQSSPGPDIFAAGFQLFMNNVVIVTNVEGPEFARYFSRTYGPHSNLCNWYEGAAPLLPMHNNSEESFNRLIKQQYTYHAQCRLPEFLFIVDDLVRKESGKAKPFNVVPTASLAEETSAYQWSLGSPEIHIGGAQDGRPLYMVKGSECTLTGDEFLRYRNQPSTIPDWKTFEAVRNSWHYVCRHKDGFSVCDCPVGIKKIICKHSLGIDILHHGYAVAPAAKDIPIGQRRGKGRPKKIGNRYQFQ